MTAPKATNVLVSIPAWLDKFWYIPTGIVLGIAGALVFSCHPTPKPDVMTQAAQKAASAIVTVEHADSALAQHKAAQTALAPVAKRLHTLRVRHTDLKAHLDSLKTQQPDTSLVAVMADSVIAVADSIMHAQDTAQAIVQHDDSTLATQLQATKDTLAGYRTPVIPAPKPSTLSEVGHFVSSHFGVTLGYGGVVDGSGFHPGPGGTIGLHLTSGAIGVTVGGTVVASGGTVHLGAGATLGLRVQL